jgi:hypothetical protein
MTEAVGALWMGPGVESPFVSPIEALTYHARMQQRNEARELGLIVATLAVLSRFVADAPFWAAAALAVIVATAGTASLLGELRP